jgi:hypothetical protein
MDQNALTVVEAGVGWATLVVAIPNTPPLNVMNDLCLSETDNNDCDWFLCGPMCRSGWHAAFA